MRIGNWFVGFIIFSSFICLSAFGQGALTPPGAPAPTMKTLDQVYAKLDSRIAIGTNTTPGDATDIFIISRSGSYYMPTNLVGLTNSIGIEIIANDVTLDLNGFALLGGTSDEEAVYILNARTNIIVRNGIIDGWGDTGVFSSSSSSQNIVCEGLNVSANDYGIYISGSGVVRSCNCQNNSIDGIVCYGGLVSGCVANNNDQEGIISYGIVSNCTAQNNGVGIFVSPGVVSGCLVQDNEESGIYLDGSGSEAIDNVCIGNNKVNSTSDAGIFVREKNVRIENNQVTASGYAGIQVYNFRSVTNSIFIKNSVVGNGANNYILPNAQIVGPLIMATGIITNSNPWANFSF